MRQDARTPVFGENFAAAAVERLFAPRFRRDAGSKQRFIALLLICLLFHAALVAFLFFKRDFDVPPAPEEAIPVEVIVEPPPEAMAEPPPLEEEPPKPEPKEKEQPAIDVKPAFDAPRAQNKETIERDAPDQETKAPRVAPPKEEAAPKPEEKQAPEDARDDANKADPDAAPQKSLEEKLDAETIEQAEPTPSPGDKQARKQTKPELKKGEAKSIAEQVASLTPLPNYELGSAAKPSPVSGGNAKTTYLSILYGMIMPNMHVPPGARAVRGTGKGIVVFYIDEMGNLTHQAVAQSSGAPELDAAAIAAIRRSAPFPAPPRGHPHGLQFTFAPK
jgi:protein TonB